MANIVADLTAQTDATLDAVTQLVSEIQRIVAQLAVLQKDAGQRTSASKDDADEIAAQIGIQIARLKQGSDAALLALRALRSSNPVGASTAAPVAPAAIVQDSAGTVSGPVAEAPAAVPAAVPATPASPANPAPEPSQKA